MNIDQQIIFEKILIKGDDISNLLVIKFVNPVQFLYHDALTLSVLAFFSIQFDLLPTGEAYEHMGQNGLVFTALILEQTEVFMNYE